MKVLSKKELKKLTPIPWNGNLKSMLLEQLARIKVGDSCLLSEKEWNSYGYKEKPYRWLCGATSRYVRNRVSGRRFSVKKFKEGWVITREPVGKGIVSTWVYYNRKDRKSVRD